MFWRQAIRTPPGWKRSLYYILTNILLCPLLFLRPRASDSPRSSERSAWEKYARWILWRHPASPTASQRPSHVLDPRCDSEPLPGALVDMPDVPCSGLSPKETISENSDDYSPHFPSNPAKEVISSLPGTEHRDPDLHAGKKSGEGLGEVSGVQTRMRLSMQGGCRHARVQDQGTGGGCFRAGELLPCPS